MAVEIAKESSGMVLPLKAVAGATGVHIKNYCEVHSGVLSYRTLIIFLQQTTANEEQIRDLEERVQSLADVLAPPVGDQNNGEKARRAALRKSALHQRRRRVVNLPLLFAGN